MTVTTHRPSALSLDGSLPDDREVLGGKAFSINRMRGLGLPVPPAFVLPTYVCEQFHDNGGALPDEVWQQVLAQLAELERQTGRTFGAGPAPLLVSVRSGAAQSMPGMMDTVLNLGLTAGLADELGRDSGDPEWAADTWARFVRSYAEIVVGDGDITVQPPADPFRQLRDAIGAVFDSWTNERVRAYRERHRLGAGGGTAVTVQAMVFGNRDQTSGTGVMFSRDPSTGEAALFGEWLRHAQGEDVVSGEKDPDSLDTIAALSADLHAELARVAAALEAELRDMVDIEFTIESGRLYMLQCRAGKRSPQAAVRIAAELAAEGLISPAQALDRVSAEQVDSLAQAHRVTGEGEVLARGHGACPGVATGHVALDLDEVTAHVEAGRDVILVREFTAPDDVPAMFSSVGVLTEVGGATSHAALVCREIGLPCIVGAGAGLVARLAGQVITIDGDSGTVYAGRAGEARSFADDPHVRALLRLAAETGATDHPIHRLVAANA